MQKIDIQLTKLNSAITGLQRAIEQLSRSQGRQSPVSNGAPVARGSVPPIAPGSPASNVDKMLKAAGLNERERQVLGLRYGLSNSFQQNSMAAAQRQAMRQSRQFAALIGGQLLGGAGDIATSLGYENFGRGISNLGAGITSGGGAGMAATMAGLGGKAAGGIGIAVGLATVISKNIASMEQLAQSVNKASQAFEANYKALHTRTVGINDSIMGIRQQDRAD